MSCEEDDDGWDPVIDVITTEKLVDIKITAISKDDIENIENAAVSALKQKLTKLNVILKNLNVYCYKNIILVNDRYSVSKDLVKIAEAFGMDIKPVDCFLRGKNYIIRDDLVDLIGTIDPTYEISGIRVSEFAEDLKDVVSRWQYSIADKGLSDILAEIKKTGAYMIHGKQTITSTYEDGRLINTREGKVVSDEEEITDRLKSYLRRTSEALRKTNQNLRDGTAELLCSRARQMGYAVKEEKKGNCIQLVLVRCE